MAINIDTITFMIKNKLLLTLIRLSFGEIFLLTMSLSEKNIMTFKNLDPNVLFLVSNRKKTILFLFVEKVEPQTLHSLRYSLCFI